VTYVQFLRLRKALTIYGIVVGSIFLFGLIVGHWPNARFDFGHGLHHALTETSSIPKSIPMSGVLFLAAWCAIIFATVLSTSLNKENDGVEMVWTKPIARERLAVQYIGLDLSAILVAFACPAVLCIIAIASVGGLEYLRFDARTWQTLIIGLGTAFMWYGLVQALTSWQRGRGGMAVGLSWAAAFLVLSFAEATHFVPGPLHQILLAADVLNPLAYFSSYSLSGYGAHASPVLPQVFAGTEMRSILTWSIGFLGCAGAVGGWKRLEV